MGNQIEFSFWIHFNKYRSWKLNFNAHENKTVLDRSKLVWTRDDLAKLKEILNKTDIIELCSRERLSTKWRFQKLPHLTVFATFLNDAPMECQNAVYSNFFWEMVQTAASGMKKIQENLITITCAFFVHLHSFRMALNNWKRKLQICTNYLLIKWIDWAPINSKGSTSTIFRLLKRTLTLNIQLYVLDFVVATIIGEIARQSEQKHENTVHLLRYNNHIVYVNNINAVFQFFRCPNCDTSFNRKFNLEQHITTCSERVKNTFGCKHSDPLYYLGALPNSMFCQNIP